MNKINEDTLKDNISKGIYAKLSESGLSQKELASVLGVDNSTVGKWLSKTTIPRMGVIQKLSDYFGVPKSFFLDGKKTNLADNSEKETLITNYDKLNTENKTKLVDYSIELLDSQTTIKENTGLYSVEVIEAVAAGRGYKYGNNESTIYYTDRSDLKHYDYATLVTGDSMVPVYNNGDIVLVQSGYDNSNGDVYVIDYDGKSYVKKLYNDGDRFRLVSINRDYDNIIIDIPIADGVYFNIIGKVVDSFTPIEL